MLCGDVPWEGSSRRSVSLQGSLSRGSSTCVPRGKAQPSCWRETGVSLVARFPPYAIVGRDDHFDWLSYKFAKASTHSWVGEHSHAVGAALSAGIVAMYCVLIGVWL